jgi:DNA replication and repair protein RecF
VSPRTCRVERLRLFRFRNYSDETVELAPGLNVVSGANAQGKTNLLEAVATLALTRSPRAASAAELITWGENACRLEARVIRPDGPTLLDVRVERTASAAVDSEVAGGERAVRRTLVDGKERAARSLLGLCPVVLFWPEDLMLVKGGPEGRRRLLDVVLSQLDQRIAVELLRYRRILEQRNALLRQLRGYGAADATLGAFTEELARSGGAIRVARHRLSSALSPLAAAAHDELSDGGEALSLRYVGGEDATAGGEGSAAELAAELASRRHEELARGVTVAGPHRDDVEFLLDGRPARTTASQGQQRSVVLACKLAEVRHVAAVAGMAPVLLLDDVLSELDGERRRRLLAGLGAGAPSQTLLTTTETSPLHLGDDAAEVRRLVVRQGHVEHVRDSGTVVPT